MVDTVKKSTILRVKRKRGEEAADTLVVEAERPVKQQKKLELLTRELDLMSVSKDLKIEFNKAHGIPNNEETLKWSSPVRDGNMKKYFRLLTSLDGQDSLSSESIEDLLKKQFDGVFDSPSKLDSVDRKRSLESRDESPSKMRSNVKLSKLDEWGTEEVMYKIVDLVEEEYDDEESTPSYSEVTLPVVRSSKEVIKEKVNDCYVDYYYMDEEETVSYRPSKSVKVPIEYFREELLNEEYVYENEYDTETEDYESDDSQNRNWGQYEDGYSSSSTGSTESNHDIYDDDDDDDEYNYYL